MVIRMPYEQAVSVAGVTKSYGEATALDGISFQVAPGTVAALLGPNGAGKTTMIRILSTLLRPDAGSARVAGYDVRRDREKVQALIGLTGQSLSVDGRLSGRENLAMFGRLHRLPWPAVRTRSAALLEVFDLAGAGKRAVKTYSGGMRRKLDLAISLMAEPRILFLDEPTTGLDPASRHALWDIIRGLVAQGTTVLLTTQYLDEADALATDVVFIAAGRVMATGTPAELKAQLELTAASDAGFALLAAAVTGFGDVHGDAGSRTVRVAVRDLAEVSEISAAAARAGSDVTRFALHEPDLDDVYFQLTTAAKEAA
jgi:daunorubicin resistance ABC transporter ATP-binding subunit